MVNEISVSTSFILLQGSWIVRQSVGSTPCLLGKAVDCNYVRGPNYLEVNILALSLYSKVIFGIVVKYLENEDGKENYYPSVLYMNHFFHFAGSLCIACLILNVADIFVD